MNGKNYVCYNNQSTETPASAAGEIQFVRVPGTFTQVVNL